MQATSSSARHDVTIEFVAHAVRALIFIYINPGIVAIYFNLYIVKTEFGKKVGWISQKNNYPSGANIFIIQRQDSWELMRLIICNTWAG